MESLRIGLVGAGAIAASHLPQLQRRPEVKVTAAADPSPSAAEFTRRFEIPRVVADYREILDDVDAVLVCTPTHLHADIVVDALRRGITVFCEKPLARTMAQADAIGADLERGGGKLQVGFVRRFDPEWRSWREAVAKGRIGRPVVWLDVAAGPGPAGAWFCDDAAGGGPFLDACIHSLDFALDLFGPAQSVFCHGLTWRKTGTAIDTGAASVRFRSGDQLSLSWSWGLPAGCRGTRVFELLGPSGTITWSAEPAREGQRRLVIANSAEAREEIAFPADALSIAYDLQMDQFVDVALGRAAPAAGFAEGKASLRLALAILESARTGSAVTLEQSP